MGTVNSILLASECVRESGSCAKFKPTFAMKKKMPAYVLYEKKINLAEEENEEYDILFSD